MDRFAEIAGFIRSTFRKDKDFIPLHAPVFLGNEKRYIEECIDSTFVSSVGKYVDQFELEIAKYIGIGNAVACVNGTNALHIALMLSGVESDDEVITTPLTFIATVNAINYCGAKPVFVDIDHDTLGLSPASLTRFLKEHAVLKKEGCINRGTGKIIKACIPVHVFGHPCKIDEIVKICSEFRIEVVEDAAESLGSRYKGRHTGIFSKIGILSFNGNKILTTGGGGMLLFNEEELARKAKHLTTQAKIPHPWEFNHDAIGYNYRMPNINAALGLAQLEKLDYFIGLKRTLAEKYRRFFTSLDIEFVAEPKDSYSNYWLCCILLNNEKDRNNFLQFTNDHGIMTRPAWKLMNELPMFRDCQVFETVQSKIISDTLVNLPSSVIPELSKDN
ncbi:MAG: LegC family aminotransferase [Bacteroidales bacterium]|nr:LegC family aminotransferase [Bacteroidales bacterium]